MRYGMQMFGVNPVFLKDPEAFMIRMASAGYRYLEPCIAMFPIPALKDHIWTAEQLESWKVLMDKHGLKLNSCHIFTQDIEADLGRVEELAEKYGFRQFVLPVPAFADIAEGEKMACVYTKAAEKLLQAGAELLIHSGKEDSVAKTEGVSNYEWFLSRCGSAVKAQPDVGWLLYSGTDPETFLWKFRDRIASLHYKDMEQCDGALAETAVGTGMLDMVACFQFARAAEIIQLVDQDGSKGDFQEDLEKAIQLLRNMGQVRDRTKSILCILDTESGELTQLKTFDKIIEAPNWLQTDDDTLIYNSDGNIYRYSISTGEEAQIPAGDCTNCNNDHVLSPDNTQIAVSHSAQGWMSQVYILPIEGGTPRLITANAPSYLHGWSPDGKELAYCAFRDHGKGMEVDIYAIGPEGGEEWQLTSNAGFNDGPEYSPDGKHIWFISTRTGLMQCWRMNRDGSEQTQMTFSRRNNWFPHVSPDNKKVVYLSYSELGLDPNEHLANMHVELSIMDADGSNDRLLLKFFGGQGSINVNSWSRDSRRLAMVIYELEHK